MNTVGKRKITLLDIDTDTNYVSEGILTNLTITIDTEFPSANPKEVKGNSEITIKMALIRNKLTMKDTYIIDGSVDTADTYVLFSPDNSDGTIRIIALDTTTGTGTELNMLNSVEVSKGSRPEYTALLLGDREVAKNITIDEINSIIVMKKPYPIKEIAQQIGWVL